MQPDRLLHTARVQQAQLDQHRAEAAPLAQHDGERALPVRLGDEPVAHQDVAHVLARGVARAVDDLALAHGEALALAVHREVDVARLASDVDLAQQREEAAGIGALCRCRGGRSGPGSRLRRRAGDGDRFRKRSRLRAGAEGLGELRRRRVALLDVDAQRPPQDRQEGFVLRTRRKRKLGLPRCDSVEGRHGRFGVERTAAGQHLVEQGADAEDVAAAVHAPAVDLLGRHVADGPEHGLARAARRDAERDAEVHDPRHVAFRQEHVGRLDVAVNDAGLVRVTQPIQHLDDDRDLLRDRQRRALAQPPQQVLPLEQLHHDVGRAVGVIAEIEDRDDAGVAQARDRARLAFEALLLFGVAGRLGEHDLERDVALEHRVEGLVDGPHAAASERLEDLVLADALGVWRRFAFGRVRRVSGGALSRARLRSDRLFLSAHRHTGVALSPRGSFNTHAGRFSRCHRR